MGVHWHSLRDSLRKKVVQSLEVGLGLFGKRTLGSRYLARDSGGHGFLAHRLLSTGRGAVGGRGHTLENRGVLPD